MIFSGGDVTISVQSLRGVFFLKIHHRRTMTGLPQHPRSPAPPPLREKWRAEGPRGDCQGRSAITSGQSGLFCRPVYECAEWVSA